MTDSITFWGPDGVWPLAIAAVVYYFVFGSAIRTVLRELVPVWHVVRRVVRAVCGVVLGALGHVVAAIFRCDLDGEDAPRSVVPVAADVRRTPTVEASSSSSSSSSRRLSQERRASTNARPVPAYPTSAPTSPEKNTASSKAAGVAVAEMVASPVRDFAQRVARFLSPGRVQGGEEMRVPVPPPATTKPAARTSTGATRTAKTVNFAADVDVVASGVTATTARLRLRQFAGLREAAGDDGEAVIAEAATVTEGHPQRLADIEREQLDKARKALQERESALEQQQRELEEQRQHFTQSVHQAQQQHAQHLEAMHHQQQHHQQQAQAAAEAETRMRQEQQQQQQAQVAQAQAQAQVEEQMRQQQQQQAAAAAAEEERRRQEEMLRQQQQHEEQLRREREAQQQQQQQATTGGFFSMFQPTLPNPFGASEPPKAPSPPAVGFGSGTATAPTSGNPFGFASAGFAEQPQSQPAQAPAQQPANNGFFGTFAQPVEQPQPAQAQQPAGFWGAPATQQPQTQQLPPATNGFGGGGGGFVNSFRAGAVEREQPQLAAAAAPKKALAFDVGFDDDKPKKAPPPGLFRSSAARAATRQQQRLSAGSRDEAMGEAGPSSRRPLGTIGGTSTTAARGTSYAAGACARRDEMKLKKQQAAAADPSAKTKSKETLQEAIARLKQQKLAAQARGAAAASDVVVVDNKPPAPANFFGNNGPRATTPIKEMKITPFGSDFGAFLAKHEERPQSIERDRGDPAAVGGGFMSAIRSNRAGAVGRPPAPPKKTEHNPFAQQPSISPPKSDDDFVLSERSTFAAKGRQSMRLDHNSSVFDVSPMERKEDEMRARQFLGLPAAGAAAVKPSIPIFNDPCKLTPVRARRVSPLRCDDTPIDAPESPLMDINTNFAARRPDMFRKTKVSASPAPKSAATMLMF